MTTTSLATPPVTTALRVTKLDVEFVTGPFYSRRRTPAVDDVSIDVAAGHTLGVVGESGSGKSTLARAIAGLCPSTGRIEIAGRDVTGAPRDFRRLAPLVQMVFQDPFASLDPRMTVGAIVEEPLIVNRRDLSRLEVRQRVSVLLDAVGLGRRRGAYPHELSGGQRQRAAIARALALSPPLVLCDEPTSGLDLTTQAQILKLLRRLQLEFESAYVFISHDLRVVHHISDEIAVMFRGRIVERGPGDRLFRAPAHPYTAALLSAIPGRSDRPAIPLRTSSAVDGDADTGCRFRHRCPFAVADCAQPPPAVTVPGGGIVECHFPMLPAASA